jgi:MFS family permease
LLSFFAGITNPLYFIPLNIYFAKKDRTNNVAKFEVGSVIGKIAFVILNGYMLGSRLNNSLLIMCTFSTILFLISVIPLIIHFKEINKELKESKLKNLFEVNKNLKKPNMFHLFFGLFSQALYAILPLYLFYSQLSVENVAYVVAITEVLKIATFYFANYLNAKNLNLINYLIGCFVILASSILIIVSNSAILLFIIGIILGITFPFVFVPAFGNYCKNINESNTISEGLILRDFYILLPRGIIFSIFFMIPSFPIMFYIGAISAVAMFFTRIEHKK